MKTAAIALAGCVWLAGCGRKSEVSAPASAAAASIPGRVSLPPDSPKLQQIRVQVVVAREVPVEQVVAPGKIQMNPNRVSHVTLPVAGRVAAVLVHIGDSVRQGQPVLTIESADADAAQSGYLQAQAAVTQARAALLKAQADLDRTRDLFQHDAVAKKEVLNAENQLSQSQAALDQAKAAETQALRRIDLLGLKPGAFGQSITIRAPGSGKVLEMTVAPGEFRNDVNASLLTIADLSTVWVSSDVPETAIRMIDPGEHLNIELEAYPGQVFQARVTRISDTVDPQTRTVKVLAEMNNPGGRLRPEMFCRIRHVNATRRLPVVPVGTVVQGDNQNVVYVEISPGTFEQRQVTVGERVGDELPIVSGLAAGDRVVTDGAMLLKGMAPA